MDRVVVALVAVVLALSGIPVPGSGAVPDSQSRAPPEIAPTTTSSPNATPSCSLLPDNRSRGGGRGNSSDGGNDNEGDDEPKTVTAQPWFTGATLGDRSADGYTATVGIDPRKLIEPTNLTLTLTTLDGHEVARQRVSVSPSGNRSRLTRNVTWRTGDYPTYLELRIDGRYVTDRVYGSIEKERAVVDTNLTATERPDGTSRIHVSMRINRSKLRHSIFPVMRAVDRKGLLRASGTRVEPVPPNRSNTTDVVVTEGLVIPKTNASHVYVTVEWGKTSFGMVGHYHDRTPDAAPRSRDPPGSPIPDVGELNWSTTTNGLDARSVALLFGRDNESRYINQSAFNDTYDKARPTSMQVANGSDHPFARPPEAAQVWTRNDFQELAAGNSDTSIVPVGAETTDGTYIKDAHATIFAVQPSTLLHRAKGTAQLYIAPSGNVTALADYRVEAPDPAIPEVPEAHDRRRLACVASSDIDVRFLEDGTVTNRTGNQTPRFNYSFNGTGMTDRSLSVEAEIETTVLKRIDEYVCPNSSNGTDGGPAPNGSSRVGRSSTGAASIDTSGVSSPIDPNGSSGKDDPNGSTGGSSGGPNGSTGGDGPNGSTCFWKPGNVTNHTEQVTVSDQVAGRVYRPRPLLSTTTYPNGQRGVAIYYSGPWSSVSLTDGGMSSVRGVWRFFTAYRTGWGVLGKHQGEHDTTYVNSPALPVQVHAYPSQIGPMADDPRIDVIERWGNHRRSPSGFGQNVEITPVQPAYNSTWGMALRSPRFERDNVTVQGIIAGTNATPRPAPTGAREPIRAANLTLAIVEANNTRAVLEVTLRDNETGMPIPLQRPPRDNPFRPHGSDPRDGYVVVDGRKVETNASGKARVVVTDPGQINARYVPEQWVSVDPAYASDRATVRWLPQLSVWYWLDIAVQILTFGLPFVVIWYGGRKVGAMFDYERT